MGKDILESSNLAVASELGTEENYWLSPSATEHLKSDSHSLNLKSYFLSQNLKSLSQLLLSVSPNLKSQIPILKFSYGGWYVYCLLFL